MTRPSWEEYFFDLCRAVQTRSHDPDKQVGCVIVGPNHEIRSTGYNGLCRGIEARPTRLVKPIKYNWIEHAERNAIYNAAYSGTSLAGCTIYIPWFPCVDCARAIIQAGIARMVCTHPDFQHHKWGSSHATATVMLEEAGVTIDYITEAAPA